MQRRKAQGPRPIRSAISATSRAIAAGNGPVSAQFPPLFPALVGWISWLGIAPLSAARGLNALLFGANILLVGVALRMSFQDRVWPAIVGALLILVTPALTGVHVMVWSEPLFIFLTLLCLILLARWLEASGAAWWLASASVAALALLTRYIGLALVLTGALGILWLGRQSLQRRAGLALLWSILALIPLTAWLLLGPTDTGRAFGLHPPGVGHLQQALITTTGWLQAPASTSTVWRILIWGVIFAWAAFIYVRRARSGTPASPAPIMLKLIGLFALSYAVMLALSITFFDANTPLDDRILSPIFVAGIFGVFYLADETIRLSPSPAGATVVLAIVALLIGVLALRQTMQTTARQHRDGIGFSSLAWKHSALLRQVAGLPANVTLFSNAPEPIYLNIGRDARPFPRPRNAMNNTPNEAFADEMSALGAALSSGDAVAIFFRTLPQRSLPSEADLRANAGVRMLAETADGAIYSGTGD